MILVWTGQILCLTGFVRGRVLYTRFVDCRLVDSRFVYTLNTKTLYSWLTKPKTPKPNAKTGGSAPQNPSKLFVAGYKQLKYINSRRIGCRRTRHNPAGLLPDVWIRVTTGDLGCGLWIDMTLLRHIHS